MTLKFLVVRHGERIDRVDSTWADTAAQPSNPPLTATGVSQALAAGHSIRSTDTVDWLYASPFTRTLQTANEIAKVVERPIHVEPGVCEWLHPDWYGGKYYWPPVAESKQNFPLIEGTYQPLVTPSGTEDATEVRSRCQNFVRELLEKHTADKVSDKKTTIVIVSHGKIVEEVCCALSNAEKLPWVTYCSITEVNQTTSPAGTEFELGNRLCDVSFMPESIRPYDPQRPSDSTSYA